MSTHATGGTRFRALARAAAFLALIAAALLAIAAIHYALALVWPAYLIGAVLIVGLLIHAAGRN
jgi:uncharacterized membrane protein YecN with MAPEG domain